MSAAPGRDRLASRFAELRAAGRAGLAAFLTAGDPDPETSRALLTGLGPAGADVVELGMPFSDPVADGPAIQAASLRALSRGARMATTLALVGDIRRDDDDTPVVLMGYYNPILAYGVKRFVADATTAGVDGVIVVDLPPEEADELARPARAAGLHLIRLATPTSDDQRLERILDGAGGFLYYVSITGITGTAAPDLDAVRGAVARLRRHTALPVAVGFGIASPAQAAAVAQFADAAVVGTALVAKVAEGLDAAGQARPGLVEAVHALVGELAAGVREARAAPAAGAGGGA